ncbi:hypothetical protein CCP2SC5_180037 [Azospirillaceae bacterium]
MLNPMALSDLPWPKLIKPLEMAQVALARLDQALSDNPSAIMKAWLSRMRVKEAVASAFMEGYGATEEKLLFIEADSAIEIIQPDDRYAFGLLRASRAVEDYQLRSRFHPDILHKFLGAIEGRGFDPESIYEGDAAQDAALRLAELLDDWTDAVRKESWPMLPALATLTQRLGQVEAPYCDGALRRLLLPYVAMHIGATRQPILMISHRLSQPSSRYKPGAVGPEATLIFLNAVAATAGYGLDHLTALNRQRERWRQKCGPRRGHSRLCAAADLALGAQVVSGKVLVERLGVSPRGATMIINELVAVGVIREISGRSRFRLYEGTP